MHIPDAGIAVTQQPRAVRVFLPIALLSMLLLLGLSGCEKSDPVPVPVQEAGATTQFTDAPSGRLPTGIRPTHYRLQLSADPRESHFSGRAEIDIQLDQATESIWIHGNQLEVGSAMVLIEGHEPVPIHYQQVLDIGVVRLTPESPIAAGSATLVFDYRAPFNTHLEGLYRVDVDSDAYAYTQFEATSARLAFPAFDEPAFKVPFDVELTVPLPFSAISNAPLVSAEDLGDGSKRLTFATSKPLPTYLVAFAIGPFDVVDWSPIATSDIRETPIPLRGITTRGKGEQIHFALKNTEKIVLGLEDYFDTAYPYAKLDILAVPDFSAGAMENAGAITYREQLLLMDENASVGQRRGYFVTHAHELAHQWFGNLVTPVWWDDIWLNEAFATWNAATVLDRIFPGQGYRDAQLANGSRIMRTDSLASARQIREPVERHADIGSAFDGITYQKGGAVLTMFESFIGADNFQNGIRHYMDEFAWANTTAADFVGAIAEANPQADGDELRAAFSSFIEQPGLPLLSTELQCKDGAVNLQTSQRRYLPMGSTGSTEQTWTIPACVSFSIDGQAQEHCFLQQAKTEQQNLGLETCPDYLLPNARGASYYRWSLPPAQWQALLEQLPTLSTAEQISVVGSLSAALNAGEIPVADFLAAMPAIAATESWRVAMAPLGDLDKIMEHVATADERDQLRQKMRRWYRPRLDELNALNNPSTEQIQFRSNLRAALARQARDPEIRATLRQQAAQWAGFEADEQIHHDALDPNEIRAALTVAVEDLGAPFVDLLWRHFLASSDMKQRQDLLISMGFSTDPSSAAILRDRILSPELRGNELYYVFFGQSTQPETRNDLWLWLQANMDAVIERIPSWNKGGLPRFVGDFCSNEKADELQAVFGPIIDGLESGPRTLANTTERIRLCTAFADFHRT